MSNRLDAAAVCLPGLESFVHRELVDLGVSPKRGERGVVPFRATSRQLYLANVWLRTASRVLVRIARFRATDFAHLERRASEVDWSPWIADDVAPEFRVSSRRSRLYHTDGIADRLHKVVGRRASRGQQTQPFVVRFDHDLCSISVDAGGTPLGHRGWRLDLGAAPLRPTMAAAMIMAATNTTAGTPGTAGPARVLDPFCGSGTIAIEAALIARGLPPGGARRFAFQSWPSFDRGTWASVRGQTAEREIAVPDGFRIEASDRDTMACGATAANAERAGVADIVDIAQRVVSHLPGDDGVGHVITNPPYGKRVGDGELTGLYRRFGAVVAERRPGWSLTVVAADRRLARRIDRTLTPAASFGHGGLPVSVLTRPALSSPAPTPSAETRPD